MKKNAIPLLAFLMAVVASVSSFSVPGWVATKYAYHSFDAGTGMVKVSESLDGEVQGTHYLCNVQTNATCVVESEVAPDANGEIHQSDLVSLVVNRVFVDLYLPSMGDTD